MAVTRQLGAQIAGADSCRNPSLTTAIGTTEVLHLVSFVRVGVAEVVLVHNHLLASLRSCIVDKRRHVDSKAPTRLNVGKLMPFGYFFSNLADRNRQEMLIKQY